MNESTARIESASSETGAATRADLIRSGRTLFARLGFDGTSIRAITRDAGTNLGAVTYHFGSKRDLYGAVLESGLRPMAARVRAAVESEGSARERMLRVVEAYFDHFEKHPDLPYLLLQEVAAGKQPPDVVLEIIGEVKDAVAGLHTEGVRDGSVREGHPLLMALSVVSQPIYMTLIAPLLASVGGVDLSKPGVRRTAKQHVLEFVNAGLEPRAGSKSIGSTTT